ncbi:hypothetical protein DMUE_0680 [Dictyocoela muelleri]|nr:hypothetical protein DMUE_0680 [Dictyocoela muelleri]
MTEIICIKTIKRPTLIVCAEKINFENREHLAISYGKFIDIYDLNCKFKKRISAHGYVIYMAIINDCIKNKEVQCIRPKEVECINFDNTKENKKCINKNHINNFIVLISNESYCTVIKNNITEDNLKNNSSYNSLSHDNSSHNNSKKTSPCNNKSIIFNGKILKNNIEPIKCIHNNKMVVILYPKNLILILTIRNSKVELNQINIFKYQQVIDICINSMDKYINSIDECINFKTINKKISCINNQSTKRRKINMKITNDNKFNNNYENNFDKNEENKFNKNEKIKFNNNYENQINNYENQINNINKNHNNDEKEIQNNDEYLEIKSHDCELSVITNNVENKPTTIHTFIFNDSKNNFQYLTKKSMINSYKVINIKLNNSIYKLVFTKKEVSLLNENNYVETEFKFANTNVLSHCFINNNHDEDKKNTEINASEFDNKNSLLIGTANGELFYFELIVEDTNNNIEKELIKLEISIENQIRKSNPNVNNSKNDKNGKNNNLKNNDDKLIFNSSDENTLLEIERNFEKLEKENKSSAVNNFKRKITIERKIIFNASTPINRILFINYKRFLLISTYGNSILYEFPDKIIHQFNNYPIIDSLKFKNNTLNLISKTDNLNMNDNKDFSENNDFNKEFSKNNDFNNNFNSNNDMNISQTNIIDNYFKTNNNTINYLCQLKYEVSVQLTNIFNLKNSILQNFYFFKELLFITTNKETVIYKCNSKDNEFDNNNFITNFNNNDQFNDNNFINYNKFTNISIFKKIPKTNNFYFFKNILFLIGNSSINIFSKNQIINTKKIITSKFYKNQLLLVHENELKIYNLDYLINKIDNDERYNDKKVKNDDHKIKNVPFDLQISTILFEDLIFISTFYFKFLIFSKELNKINEYELEPLFSIQRINIIKNRSILDKDQLNNKDKHNNTQYHYEDYLFLAVTLTGNLISFTLENNNNVKIKKHLKRNQLSKIFKFENKFLITGDVPLLVDENLKIQKLGIDRVDAFKNHDNLINNCKGHDNLISNYKDHDNFINNYKNNTLNRPTLYISIDNSIFKLKSFFKSEYSFSSISLKSEVKFQIPIYNQNNHQGDVINNIKLNNKINNANNISINKNTQNYFIGSLIFNKEINSELVLILNNKVVKKLYFKKEIIMNGDEIDNKIICITNYENFKVHKKIDNADVFNDIEINNKKEVDNDENKNSIISKIYLISTKLSIIDIFAQQGPSIFLSKWKNSIATSNDQFLAIYFIKNDKIHFKSKLRIPIFPYNCFFENKSLVVSDFINGFGQYLINEFNMDNQDNSKKEEILLKDDKIISTDDKIISTENEFISTENEFMTNKNEFISTEVFLSKEDDFDSLSYDDPDFFLDSSLISFSSPDNFKNENNTLEISNYENNEFDNFNNTFEMPNNNFNNEFEIIQKKKFYGSLEVNSLIYNFEKIIVADKKGRIIFFNNDIDENNNDSNEFEIKSYINYKEKILSFTKGSFFESSYSDNLVYFSTINGSVGVISKVNFEEIDRIIEIQEILRKNVILRYDENIFNDNFKNTFKDFLIIDVDLIADFYNFSSEIFDSDYEKFKKIVDEFIKIID